MDIALNVILDKSNLRNKMNLKKTACVLIALVIGGMGMAQESDMSDRKIRFGLQASPNFGWLKPNIKELAKDGLEPRMGFGYGLMMDYKFSESPNYMFSTGLNMVYNGGSMSEPWDSTVVSTIDTITSSTTYIGQANRTYRMQYVTIPLLLKMRTNEIGYMSYFAAVGLDVGIRTRALVNNDYTWNPAVGPADQKDLNIQQDIQLFRSAINITGGGEFNLSGNTNIYVALGYHNGITNMFRKTDSNRILEPDNNGDPELDVAGNTITSRHKKALSQYISLDIGIFF